MKRLMMMLILVLGSTANANDALEITGFTKGKEDASKRTYVFHGETEYTISKNSFFKRSEAEKFCREHNANLASFVDVMVVAMSGAGNVDSDLKDAVYYKPKKAPAGMLLAWTELAPEEGQDVEYMVDGRGTSTDTASFAEIHAGLLKSGVSFGLRAVCTRKLKPEASTSPSSPAAPAPAAPATAAPTPAAPAQPSGAFR